MNLEKGTLVPNFILTDKDGIQKTLHNISGRKIVYFFPMAFGAESIEQAKSFQDAYCNLKDLDISEIIGISIDNEEKLSKFREEFGLDYILVSDKKKDISKSFGVYKNRIFVKFAERITFVIDNENRIEKIYSNGFLNEENGVLVENYAKVIENEIGVSLLNERLTTKLES